MREDLPLALKVVFGAEGGYVNDPDDPGGPTKYGVTQLTYNSYRDHHNLARRTVKLLNLDEAAAIYQDMYWTPAGCDNLPWPLSLIAFDSAVNSGIGNAFKWLKLTESVNDPKTRSLQIIELRRTFYLDIIKRKPSQIKYKNGWMNRMDKLTSVVLNAV